MRERLDRFLLRGCFADDGTADPGAGGLTFRLLEDTGTIYWPACVPSYVTGGSAGAWTLQTVDASHGLPITGTVAVSGTVAATQSGTWNIGTVTALTAITNALPAGTNVIGHVITDTGSTTAVTGNVTVVQATAASLNATVVGTGTFVVQAAQSGTWTIQPGNTANTTPWLMTGSGTAGTAAAGVLTVQGIASMTPLLVTPAANSAVNVAQLGGTNLVTGGVNGTVAVGGNVATNVAIGTNPVNLGAQAISAENAAVTATRLAQLVTDLVGKLIVLPYANPENFVSGAITTAMTGTTSTSLIAAPASGLRNYITQITVSNAHATVGTDIIIQDGSGGTTLYTIPAAAVYGGATITFPTPLRQPTTATAIFCANVTTGASTKVSASGYKGA